MFEGQSPSFWEFVIAFVIVRATWDLVVWGYKTLTKPAPVKPAPVPTPINMSTGLPEDVSRELTEWCATQGKKRSEALTEAVREYLAKHPVSKAS